MTDNFHPRKQLVVKQDFQYRYAAMILLVVFLFTNLSILIAYLLFLNEAVVAWMRETFQLDQTWQIMVPILGVAQVLGFIITAGVATIVSHRIAGPLYRLERDLEELSSGDFSLTVRFRKGDEFQEIAEAMNAMVVHVRHSVKQAQTHCQDLKDAIAELPKKERERPDLAPLWKAVEQIDDQLSWFRTTLPVRSGDEPSAGASSSGLADDRLAEEEGAR